MKKDNNAAYDENILQGGHVIHLMVHFLSKEGAEVDTLDMDSNSFFVNNYDGYNLKIEVAMHDFDGYDMELPLEKTHMEKMEELTIYITKFKGNNAFQEIQLNWPQNVQEVLDYL